MYGSRASLRPPAAWGHTKRGATTLFPEVLPVLWAGVEKRILVGGRHTITIVSGVLSLVDFGASGIPSVLIGLVFPIPFLALLWRRLQDAGLSGLLICLIIVPVIGQLALVWMALLPSWDGREKSAA